MRRSDIILTTLAGIALLGGAMVIASLAVLGMMVVSLGPNEGVVAVPFVIRVMSWSATVAVAAAVAMVVVVVLHDR